MILAGHALGAIVAMYANEVLKDEGGDNIVGVILLDPTSPFSGKLKQIANGVIQGTCAVTFGKKKKSVEGSLAGKLIQVVTEKLPQLVHLKDEDLEVDMTEEAKQIKLNVACGTIKKINTYMDPEAFDRLTEALPPESAIIFGQGQKKYGVFEYDEEKPAKDQIIKASFDSKEHFIHFPYTWDGKKGHKGEEGRVVEIVENFLKNHVEKSTPESEGTSSTGSGTSTTTVSGGKKTTTTTLTEEHNTKKTVTTVVEGHH